MRPAGLPHDRREPVRVLHEIWLGGDLRGRGVEPPELKSAGLGLPGPLLGLSVEAGIPDGNGRLAGEGAEEGLILCAEPSIPLLLGEIELSQQLPLCRNGNPQEALHGRMAWGKARRAGMSGEIARPQK